MLKRISMHRCGQRQGRKRPIGSIFNLLMLFHGEIGCFTRPISPGYEVWSFHIENSIGIQEGGIKCSELFLKLT